MLARNGHFPGTCLYACMFVCVWGGGGGLCCIALTAIVGRCFEEAAAAVRASCA